MDEIAGELKEGPPVDRIDQILSQLLDSHKEVLFVPGIRSLNVYSALVNHTLPSVYSQINQQAVVHIFASLPGISCLIGRIQALAETINVDGKAKEYTQNESIYSHINLLGFFLGQTLQHTTVSEIWKRTEGSKLHQQEIIALYGGSRILTRVSAARFLLDQVSVHMDEDEKSRYEAWDWISGESYTEFVGRIACELGEPPLFEKCWKLGYPRALCRALIQPSSIESTVDMFKKLRQSEQRRIMIEILAYFEDGQFVNDQTPAQRVSAVAAIMNLFVLEPQQRTHLIDFGLRAKSIDTRRVIALLCNEPEYFMSLIKQWGDKIGIKHNSLSIQEAQTQMIFLIMSQLSPNELRQASSTADYLNAISNRLGSPSDRARIFGTLVAETVSHKAPEKGVRALEFNLGVLQEEQQYWKEVVAKYEDKVIAYAPTVWKILSSPQRSSSAVSDTLPIPVEKKRSATPSSHSHSQSQSRKKREPRIQPINSDDEDDDDSTLKPYPFPEHDPEDSDSDDEDPTPNKEVLRPPAYIKDLLTYLASDQYQKHLLALDAAADLIRRKAKFGQELEFNAKSLAEILAGITDQFDIDEFNEKRLKGLSALVASAPTIVPQYLASLVFSGDYSIQQRMVILSSLSLGARELAGLDNYDNQLFPSKKLPNELLDNAFNGLHAVEEDLQRKLLKPTTEKAKDELSGPQVLRISKRLQNERTHGTPTGTRSTYNRYAKLAARHFILPLTTTWHNLGGVGLQRLGSYSEILCGHFFKTLALLLHASYPTCSDIPDLTSEYLELILSQRNIQNQDSVAIEGLLTMILVILQVNEGEFLVTKWSRQVVEIKAWLDDSWQSIIDERVRGMAAGVVYQLNELTEKWQRRLIGQFAGLEMNNEPLRLS